MASHPLIDIYCHIYPEAFFQEMTKVIETYAPWRLGISRYRYAAAGCEFGKTED